MPIAYKMLIGIPEERKKTASETLASKGLRGTGGEGMHWIYLARDEDQWQALVNAVMNLRDP
jgi:hypothetical protein